MKRFYPLTGFIISVFIALLGYVLRANREEVTSSLFTFIGAFTNAYLSWLMVQWVIQWDRPTSYGWKSAIAIAGCMLISLMLFYGIRNVGEIRERVETLPRGMHAVHFLLLMRGMVIGGFLYFIAYLLRMSALSQQSLLENEQLKKENLQAKLSLLQEQVNPHFLFNSLGTLRSMVHEDAPRAFIGQLAEVYRYLLGKRMVDLVELHTELDFAQAYLHILQERFEDALVVEINVASHYFAMKLPPMTLQLLIENTVKHNIVDAEAPLHLHIHASGADRLTIRNSLRPKQVVGNQLGTGLNNIRDRYRLLADREIEVSQTTDEFIVSIFLLNR